MKQQGFYFFIFYTKEQTFFFSKLSLNTRNILTKELLENNLNLKLESYLAGGKYSHIGSWSKGFTSCLDGKHTIHETPENITKIQNAIILPVRFKTKVH